MESSPARYYLYLTIPCYFWNQVRNVSLGTGNIWCLEATQTQFFKGNLLYKIDYLVGESNRAAMAQLGMIALTLVFLEVLVSVFWRAEGSRGETVCVCVFVCVLFTRC